MVQIKRSSRRKRTGAAAILSWRNLIAALLILQGLRLLFSGTSTKSTPPQKGREQDTVAKGIREQLEDSRNHKPPQSGFSGATAKLGPGPSSGSGFAGNDRKSGEGGNPQDEASRLANHGKNENVEALPGRGVSDNTNDIVLNRRGTGATPVGYIKDFVFERNHPSFRNDVREENPSEARKTVASLVGEQSVASCEIVKGGERLKHPKCSDVDTPLIAYNAAPFPRFWCGHHIKPLSAVSLDSHCADTTTNLFNSESPPVSGQGMDPIIVKSHDDVVMHESDLQVVGCSIPCKEEKHMVGGRRFIDGEPWTIFQTMEESYSHPEARVERTSYRQDHYYSTQSFKSSVPLPVFDFSKYNMRDRPATNWDVAKNKAIYLVDSNCASQGSKRQKYYHATQSVFPVDAYGACHHNADVPAGMSLQNNDDRLALMNQYRMVLAFDSTSEKDHISHIVWESFMSGSLPVVLGADNMKQHMPKNSFIWAGDFGHWDELAQYIKKVAANKTLWESYHDWRNDPNALLSFEAKYDFTRVNPTCRLCKWAYAKKYGLGWDHNKQTINETRLPRKLCVSSPTSMVVSPFQEVWVIKSENPLGEDKTVQGVMDTQNCDSATHQTTIHAHSVTAHRHVVVHDGVFDISVGDIEKGNSDTAVLRLKFGGIKNPSGAYFLNTHALVPTARGAFSSSASIQDEYVKVTVIADWITNISSKEEGVLDVVVSKPSEISTTDSARKRIRIIIEDMDKLHDKMTEHFPSSFGKRMIQDFIDPLLLYFPDS